jgi:hypothetical protein
MIKLSTVDQIEDQPVPITIEPKVEGKIKKIKKKKKFKKKN